MNFDLSYQLQSMRNSPIRSRRVRPLLHRDDTLNLSPILNENSFTITRNLNDTSLRQVLDESSILVSSDNAGDRLPVAFFEIIQSSRPSDVIDTLSRLSQTCCDTLELLEPWNRYNANNYWLAEEANTWKLLHCLYADSINNHPESIENLIPELTLSQKKLVEALFLCDSELRLLQLLTDWLEATAAYQEAATKTAAPIVGNNVHWGNTLHQLLIGSSLFNKEKNKAMVTVIDPDAPRRQKKSIHSDDQQDDEDLCKKIFKEVRCGNFKEAIGACISAGQAWRGAVLQGWRLLHYNSNPDSNDTLELVGNPTRDLWKWACLGLCNDLHENMYYRATLGVLCGHLSSVLPACRGNWEDLVWAHLRVQIEARVDKFLREHHMTAQANTTSTEVLEMLQAEHELRELSIQQVFSEVNALMDGKKESLYQTCQRHLMLGHIREIMQESESWLQIADERFIRFVAHLVLVLRLMGKDPDHNIGNQILERYVSQLIESLGNGSVDCPELIAYYTSTVPKDSQVTLYAALMDKIHKREYREGVVKAGLSANIDVAASARIAIKKAINEIQQQYGNNEEFTQNNVIEKDKVLVSKNIESLEWLALMPNQSQEALWLSNAMIRTFIFIGNTNAATSCLTNFNLLFPAIVKNVSTECSELREHLCLKAYLEALDAFATWYRHFISGKPKDVEALPPDASFTDKVHHEQRTAQIEQQKIRWENSILHQSKHTKNLLYNVLLFPGGWLQDENDNSTSVKFSEQDQKDRTKQLETLRSLCIPEVVLLILKILQSNDKEENHKEALKLSEIIAGENRCLYKVFSKEKLIEVLDRFKESSYVLIEKGKDMFGNEIENDDE